MPRFFCGASRLTVSTIRSSGDSPSRARSSSRLTVATGSAGAATGASRAHRAPSRTASATRSLLAPSVRSAPRATSRCSSRAARSRAARAEHRVVPGDHQRCADELGHRQRIAGRLEAVRVQHVGTGGAMQRRQRQHLETKISKLLSAGRHLRAEDPHLMAAVPHPGGDARHVAADPAGAGAEHLRDLHDQLTRPTGRGRRAQSSASEPRLDETQHPDEDHRAEQRRARSPRRLPRAGRRRRVVEPARAAPRTPRRRRAVRPASAGPAGRPARWSRNDGPGSSRPRRRRPDRPTSRRPAAARCGRSSSTPMITAPHRRW